MCRRVAPITSLRKQSAKLDEAKKLIDEGGDWDRRNRLKLYRALHCMFVRDFKTAAALLLDCVATFTVRGVGWFLLRYIDSFLGRGIRLDQSILVSL